MAAVELPARRFHVRTARLAFRVCAGRRISVTKTRTRRFKAVVGGADRGI